MITKEEFEKNCEEQSLCEECSFFRDCVGALGNYSNDLTPWKNCEFEKRYETVVRYLRKKKLEKLLS